MLLYFNSIFTRQLLACTCRRRLARRLLFSSFSKNGPKSVTFDVQRARILTLHREGHSEREIDVKMTVARHNPINNFELYGSYFDKKNSGRPRKTSRKDDHMMKLNVSRSPPVLAKKKKKKKKKKKQANLLQKGLLKFFE